MVTRAVGGAAGAPESERDVPDDDTPCLWLPGTMREEILEHLRAALPNEGCGLLAARRRDGRFDADRFYPGTNADGSPVRYTMNPREVVDAFKDMRERELDLGAIVHSHPATEARPSPTDMREAYYPDALMVIVSFQFWRPVMRAWRIEGKAPDAVARECAIVDVAG
jgi:[CysO sulfur-carrier protein]-S-L-cysteine hydrolase